jgi:hypothetical protein
MAHYLGMWMIAGWLLPVPRLRTDRFKVVVYSSKGAEILNSVFCIPISPPLFPAKNSQLPILQLLNSCNSSPCPPTRSGLLPSAK